MSEGKSHHRQPGYVRQGCRIKDGRSQYSDQKLWNSDDTLAEVEDFKAQLTKHNAWDLPFMGYVNEDGYGYAYVPDAAVAYDPYWDSHKAFLELPEDVQAAFAIRLLFAHRPVDRYGASMFLHYQRGFNVKFEGVGANNY